MKSTATPFAAIVKALKKAGIPLRKGKGRGMLAVAPYCLYWIPAAEAYSFLSLAGKLEASPKKPNTRTRARAGQSRLEAVEADKRLAAYDNLVLKEKARLRQKAKRQSTKAKTLKAPGRRAK